MKIRILVAICFLLSLGMLQAQDLYGAFRIKTFPRGADVNLYDIDEYLCETPSPVFPVYMDDYMEYREGIPGREIVLMITKRGYQPLKKKIFVPFLYTDLDEAMDNPTVFKVNLKRDFHRRYYDVCSYYSIRVHRERPIYINWTPGFHPWYPHGHHHQNPPWNPGGHGHGSGHGHNPPPPPPPPGGGQHDGGTISPPPGGGHGGGQGGGNHDGGITPPINPPGGGHGSYNLDSNSNAASSNQISRPPAKPDNPSANKIEKDTRPVNIDRRDRGSGSVIVISKPQVPEREEKPQVSKPADRDKPASPGTVVQKPRPEKQRDHSSAPEVKPGKPASDDRKSYKADDKPTKDKPAKDDEDDNKKDKAKKNK